MAKLQDVVTIDIDMSEIHKKAREHEVARLTEAASYLKQLFEATPEDHPRLLLAYAREAVIHEAKRRPIDEKRLVDLSELVCSGVVSPALRDDVLDLISEVETQKGHGQCPECKGKREVEDMPLCLRCNVSAQRELLQAQETKIQAMVAWAEADEAQRAFDCPHDAEHRCNCVASERVIADRAERAREKAFAVCDVKEITGVHNMAPFDPAPKLYQTE